MHIQIANDFFSFFLKEKHLTYVSGKFQFYNKSKVPYLKTNKNTLKINLWCTHHFCEIKKEKEGGPHLPFRLPK